MNRFLIQRYRGQSEKLFLAIRLLKEVIVNVEVEVEVEKTFLNNYKGRIS
ncbi:MAG: hypothetical protein HOE30_16780 [Deltaproteobacteria bacterium]|nr:hypothetical protein [Deltaproteobacteria bacterium]MBT6615261.1 hypothetical protein [Deltaproteobacteria bacterium]MBT7151644.1 hypothetical protein [Deltaproteobacteria bacterium]